VASWTEFYCDATNGSNLNAGSTTSGSAAYTATNGGWNSGTGVFTPTSGNPSLTVSVGDFASVYLDAATVTNFVGRVTAVSATTITVSITIKSGTIPTTAGTGLTCKVGGVWKGPNGASGFPFGFITNAPIGVGLSSPRVNLKNNATYAVTAAMTHSNPGLVTFQGYSAAAGDGGVAIIDGGTSGASYVVLTMSPSANSPIRLVDLKFQNNGASGSAIGVVLTTSGCYLLRVKFTGTLGSGVEARTPTLFEECEAWACNSSNTASNGGISVTSSGDGTTFLRCVSHDNAGANSGGFVLSGSATLAECVADTNGQHGFNCAGVAKVYLLYRCTAYGNAARGVNGADLAVIENCVVANNTGVGANAASFSTNNGFFSNTGGDLGATTTTTTVGTVTFASAPMSDPANGNFTVTLATGKGAGRGAFSQNAGSYSGTTTGYPDLGAVQHQDAGTGARLVGPGALVTPGGCT
jgi:hypothetical protein